MTALGFLLAVVVLSLLGGLLLWIRERSPRSMEAHIREFERQRQALSPEPLPPQRQRPAPSPRARGPRSG